MFERAREHWRQYEERSDESHIWRHHLAHHGGEGEPEFHIRPIQFHRTALNRQLTEAVLIGRRGDANVLNNKGEYNRCQISRLTLGEEKRVEPQPTEVGEDSTEKEKGLEKWEEGKLKDTVIK